MEWVYLTKSIICVTKIDRRYLQKQMSTILRIIDWELSKESSASQLKYLQSTKNKYKTKNFDTEAEQWRTEQEISGKLK